MATSNDVDRLIVFLPDSDVSRKVSGIQDHRYCNSSSSQTPLNTIIVEEDQLTKEADAYSSALKIQVPSSTSTGQFNGDDDPKTPTSTEHRIPVMATCPLAPKKTMWVNSATRKRKVPFSPVPVPVPADFIAYVEAMVALNEAVYIPDIMVGDLGAGNRGKRLKLLPSSVLLPANEP